MGKKLIFRMVPFFFFSFLPGARPSIGALSVTTFTMAPLLVSFFKEHYIPPRKVAYLYYDSKWVHHERVHITYTFVSDKQTSLNIDVFGLASVSALFHNDDSSPLGEPYNIDPEGICLIIAYIGVS
jgi:hypothetical protein